MGGVWLIRHAPFVDKKAQLVTLATSSGKCIASVWHPSVGLSVCPIFFQTLIGRATHTQRDSPEGSTRRGQRMRTDVLVVR